MANKKSAQNPYKWANGSYHTRPERNSPAKPKKPLYGPNGSRVLITDHMTPADRAKLGSSVTSYMASPGYKKAAAANAPPVQPLDPNVVNAQVTSTRNIQVGDAQATFQQGNLDQDYGFGAGGAANPYSRAALLQENFKRSQLGTTNSYASQGQLYSGAYGRMQGENQRNYSIGYDQLHREYDQRTGDIAFGRLQNYADAGTNVSQSQWAGLYASLGKL